jgi:hypothetical protein
VDTNKPVIYCLIAYPVAFGHVVFPRVCLVPLDEVEQYVALGFKAIYDPADQQALADWERDQRWFHRRNWMT